MGAVKTNQGRAINTNFATGLNTPTTPIYMGLGSGATAAVATATALSTEYTTGTFTGYARISSTVTRTTTSVANDTANWTATFTMPAAGATPTNFGLFDALTVGNLYALNSFTGLALLVGDTLACSFSEQYT